MRSIPRLYNSYQSNRYWYAEAEDYSTGGSFPLSVLLFSAASIWARIGAPNPSNRSVDLWRIPNTLKSSSAAWRKGINGESLISMLGQTSVKQFIVLNRVSAAADVVARLHKIGRAHV